MPVSFNHFCIHASQMYTNRSCFCVSFNSLAYKCGLRTTGEAIGTVSFVCKLLHFNCDEYVRNYDYIKTVEVKSNQEMIVTVSMYVFEAIAMGFELVTFALPLPTELQSLMLGTGSIIISTQLL